MNAVAQADDAAGQEGDERWFVVRTLRAREPLAEKHLRFQGYPTYLPLHWSTSRRAGRFRTTQAALFPGYLFVTLDLRRDRWRSVNGTVGVASLIMAGDRPTPVPRGLIEDLIALFAAPDTPRFQLRAGDSVRLVSGPFATQVGRLQSIDGAGRVKILLEIMGGQTPVWTQADCLAPAA